MFEWFRRKQAPVAWKPDPNIRTDVPRRSRSEVLTLLSESEGHVAMRLRDGTIREGWLHEVTPTSLVFDHAPSPFYAQAHGTAEMSPPPERIAIADLEAWMDDERRWNGFSD